MQVGKRSAREHYPGSLVSDRSWKPALFCIKGPRNHPMRPIGIAGLVLSDGSVLLLWVAPQSM